MCSTQSALLGEIHEKTDRLIRDAILRVVEVKTGAFDSQPLAPVRIIGKERPQMHIADLLVMAPQAPSTPAAPSVAASSDVAFVVVIVFPPV